MFALKKGAFGGIYGNAFLLTPIIERRNNMLVILKEKFVSFDEGLSVVIAELAVDSKTELPTESGIEGRKLSPASLAWEISTGEFYGFGSDGKWVNQTTGELYEPTPAPEPEPEPDPEPDPESETE